MGDLSNGSVGAIVVEVAIDSGLPVSTPVSIWDGIYNHVDALRDETLVEYVVHAPPEAIWEKRIDGDPWYSGISVTVDTTQVVAAKALVNTHPARSVTAISVIWRQPAMALRRRPQAVA